VTSKDDSHRVIVPLLIKCDENDVTNEVLPGSQSSHTFFLLRSCILGIVGQGNSFEGTSASFQNKKKIK